MQCSLSRSVTTIFVDWDGGKQRERNETNDRQQINNYNITLICCRVEDQVIHVLINRLKVLVKLLVKQVTNWLSWPPLTNISSPECGRTWRKKKWPKCIHSRHLSSWRSSPRSRGRTYPSFTEFAWEPTTPSDIH